MKQKYLRTALWLLAAFAVWTALICYVDVQAIGPKGSSVGFAAINRYFHSLTGVHMTLYTVTDWLGMDPAKAAQKSRLQHPGSWRLLPGRDCCVHSV